MRSSRNFRRMVIFTMLAVAALQMNMASATPASQTHTGGYTSGYESEVATPNTLGPGTAAAVADWNAGTGQMTTSASATSDGLGGQAYYGAGLGGSEAAASSFLFDTFTLPTTTVAGSLSASVSFTVTSIGLTSSKATDTVAFLYGLDSFGYSAATVAWAVTWYQTGSCSTTYSCATAQAYDYAAVTQTGTALSTPLSITVGAGEGVVSISVYITSYAKANGRTSSASSAINATLNSATINYNVS